MPNRLKFKHYFSKDVSFANLMQKRIYNILLIARKYDAFMLEDDGRVNEQIFEEYTSLNLRYPPRFTQVVTQEEALTELSDNRYDLIITMPGMEQRDIFSEAKEIKTLYPSIPIVILTPFSREVSQRLANEDLSAIDYVFSWLGNTDLLLAIIKLLEDKMNAEEDVESVDVQMILFVEDSIRFTSSILPHLYKFVLQQSQRFSKEALNEHERMLRMRGRPKIMLARTYEEAVKLYNRYKNNMLGIVSDVSFIRKGKKDERAGLRLGEYIRSIDPFVPLVFESSEEQPKETIERLNAVILDKNSKKLPVDLRDAIKRKFGFGDFIFVDPQTNEEIARATNLKEFQKHVLNIPDESAIYHGSQNQFSRWLYSRALFPLGKFVEQHRFSEYEDTQAAKQAIFDAIVQYRKMKNRGVVAIFDKDRYDKYSNFARIGEGSLGGKGRGLAFIDSIIKSHPELDEFEDIGLTIPKTVVLCTDIFDEFMDNNNLFQLALSDFPDEQILNYFLRAKLPDHLLENFLVFFEATDKPIAIRSSSLLEDAHYQPFAGVYSTYMIPRVDDKYEMIRMVSDAIKAVYASVFFSESKAYMLATSNVIDQEKMSIILQETVGTQYGQRFYPTFSGVARSLNFYPINYEQPEEGIANVALGLGKYIVDGGLTLRFSPAHPNNILQTSSLDYALRETQTQFYALDMQSMDKPFTVDDSFNLVKLSVKEAEADDSIRYISSTFDPSDQMIRDGFYEGGRKIISFANVLQHDYFPLAPLLQRILKIGEEEMGCPVEIEFAVNLKDSDFPKGGFYWLQMRPIVDTQKELEEDIRETPIEQCLLQSNSALGHGIINDLYDVIYVKPEAFSASNNQLVAYEIEKLNKAFAAQERNYILVGPGRWGSSDTWLGIPVKWAHISMAKIIVESGLEQYRIDPSQGTHFFQNLTSFGVGYFTINPFMDDGVFDVQTLDQMPAVFESKYLRHVRFDRSLIAKIDGKKGYGVVLKPCDESLKE